MEDRAAGARELDRIAATIDSWATAQLRSNPTVLAVDRGGPGEYRWYVRLSGEEKDVYTIWFTLRQRSLFFETYFTPAPIRDAASFYELLLKANAELHGMAFSIGEEEAVFLNGHVPVGAVDADELDRITGSIWSYVERFFPLAIRAGFAGPPPAVGADSRD